MINGQHSVAETDKDVDKLILVSTPLKNTYEDRQLKCCLRSLSSPEAQRGMASERGMARVSAGTKMFCLRACTHFA